MVFNINIGFGNIANNSAKDEAGKIAAVFIGDTVVVNEVWNRYKLRNFFVFRQIFV